MKWMNTLTCMLLFFCLGMAVSAEEKPKGPARFEAEIQKFEAAVQANPLTPGSIVFYGSSSARLWDLPQSFPQLVTVNRGFGGSDMAAANHFYERVIPPLKPQLIVLYEGDNDLNSGQTPCQVLAEFDALVAKHRVALPETKLICLSIKYSPSRARLRLEQEAANALLKARCAKDDQLLYVDVSSSLLNANGQPDPRYFLKDMLHLNSDGYAAWNAVLLPHLQTLSATQKAIPPTESNQP